MSQFFEEYLFSQHFEDLFKKYNSDFSNVRIEGVEKINNGLSNVLFKVAVEIKSEGVIQNKNIIVKFYLDSGSGFKHSMEYYTLTILQAYSFFIPKSLFYAEFESYSFLVMEFIDGLPFDSVLESSSTETQLIFISQVISSLNSLHNLPIDDVRKKLSVSGISIEKIDQLDSYLTSMNDLITKSGLKEFNCLYNWLIEHKPSSSNSNFCLIHNDFHPYNMIKAHSNDIFIVDWEGFKIGRPEIDIAWFTFVTAGITNQKMEQIILKEYNKQVVNQLSIQELEYYMILCSGFRLVVFAIILNDIENVRENDPTYKNRILNLYKNTIQYILKRINDLLGFSFPSLDIISK